jgi:O-antigen/teichoic acid export membrane protein
MTQADGLAPEPPRALDPSVQVTPPARRRPSLASVVGRLSAVNVMILLLGFVTGPLQARALGPSGRGTLAAILLPLTLAPTVLSLGLGTYIIREAARGRKLGVLVGSVGSLLVLIGVIAATAGPAVAGLFAGGRDVVYVYVLAGFLLMPISMASWVLIDIANGLERWRSLVYTRLIPPVVSVIGIVVLYAFDRLTVASAAVISIAGGLLAVVPLLGLAKEVGRPRFDRAVAGEGVSFGLRAWLGGLGSLANLRLDQILMTRLVAPQELGLYVVAVTVSGFFVNPVVSAMQSALAPRFAAGDPKLVARVVRTTLLGVLVMGVAVAAVTPVLVTVLFGSAFRDSIPLAWILIAGSIPLAGVSVLSSALTIGGHPGFSAVSELVALTVTIPALVIALPQYGATGAAVVSGVAYAVNLAFLAFGAHRHLRVPWRELMVVRRTDLADLGAVARRMLAAVARRRRT